MSCARLAFGALLGLLVVTPVSAAEDDVLARVAGESVTIEKLRRYATLNPVFLTELQVPGGPKRVLDNLINERLLVLEGERRGIERPRGDPSGILYALAVRKELIKSCPAPDEEAIRAFYDQHLERFSTPLLLRLRRLALPLGDNPETAMAEAAAIKARIEAGQADLGRLADERSVDPIGQGRGGDLGFLSVQADDPVMNALARLPVGAISAPFQQKGFVAIYQVTGRHEPIPEPFASARERVSREMLTDCDSRAFGSLLKEMKSRWPVEVYAQEIGWLPEDWPVQTDANRP